MLVLIIGTIGILVLFTVEIFRIYGNYQAGMFKINQCFDNERTTVMEVETSYSYSKITCK